MVKIFQTGLLDLNFETVPKKAFFGFCQKFPQAMDEVQNFFANFQTLGPLGHQWVVIPQNVKSQNHCTLILPPQTFVHIALLAEKNWGSIKAHNLVLVYRKAV